MSRKVYAYIMFLMIAGVGACAHQTGRPAVELNQKQQLGYLEHRRVQYPIRDLMDPTLRATSPDEFIRNFEPETALVFQQSLDDASR